MSSEHRAVLLLLGLALAGQGVRTWLATPGGGPPGEVSFGASTPVASPRAHRDSSLQHAAPLRPGDRVDLDRANTAEISRLPRIGPGLARAIVADREARGPFGGLEGLDRVQGVGPGLLAAIAPHARFSGVPATAGAPPPPAGAPTPAGAGLPVLDLNSATAAELQGLPFVGPYMAEQVVRYRERHGPFASVDSLVRVPGVGPATLARVKGRLRVGG